MNLPDQTVFANPLISKLQGELAGDTGKGSGICQKAVMRVLQSLQTGHLVIIDEPGGHTVHHFGCDDSKQLRADITIKDATTWTMIAGKGALGAAEAYMQGYWDSKDLLSVLRIFAANQQTLLALKNRIPAATSLMLKLFNRMKKNTLTGSRDNIHAHYDLGNDFFSLFLDKRMMYSSAIFPDPFCSLEHASEFKLQQICESLKLEKDQHLLEIGTGWGGFAIYAASHYGVRVTTTTISREQFQYATEQVKKAGLQDRIDVILKDYRELEGRYDKIVSIEMIEAVGHQYFDTYFSKISHLLKADGLACIQAITINHNRYHAYKGSTDFIQRYIFPGGCLPSIKVITDGIAKNTDMEVINTRDIGRDYARTLAHWRLRFEQKLDAVREQGFDDTFIRMWRYYLCYCEAGFTERSISTVQMTFARPGYRQD